MSAWIVHRHHINALCYLAAHGATDSEGEWQYGGHFSYYHDGKRHEVARVPGPELDELGRMLWVENHESINYLYGGDGEPEEFRYSRPTRRPTTIEGLKIVGCFAYQSCEHDGWNTSQAKAFCDALHHALVDSAPGYDNAPWGWDSP